LFLKNAKILIFGEIWAVLGKSYADFDALAMVDSMPKLWLKS
jgi:hypothetical protein